MKEILFRNLYIVCFNKNMLMEWDLIYWCSQSPSKVHFRVININKTLGNQSNEQYFQNRNPMCWTIVYKNIIWSNIWQFFHLLKSQDMTLWCFWANILFYIIKYQPIVPVHMQITSWAPFWFHDYIIKLVCVQSKT